jgi:DNA-binding winged helix-turn-helix (wHTH) protein|tara:strand:+ start:206 stop:1201 length:996 start_codon:yes stop_codon:yes gene_type:complete
MTKQTNSPEKQPETLVKEAIRKHHWILLVGGTNKERTSLGTIAHENKKDMKRVDNDVIELKEGFERDRKGGTEVPPEFEKEALEIISQHKEKTFTLIDVNEYSNSDELMDGLSCNSLKIDARPGDDPKYISPLQYLGSSVSTLFIDNLICKDEEYSNAINKIVAYIRRLKGVKQNTTLGTLIVGIGRTEDLKEIPQQFLDMFESKISLDEDSPREVGIDKVIIKVAEKSLNRRDIDKEASLLPIQVRLLKFLYGKRNTHVTRDDILKQLWYGGNVYDDQVTDHVSKLVEAFVYLGFEKDVVKQKIIETVKQSSKRKGGYIFHNNLVLLDYD